MIINTLYKRYLDLTISLIFLIRMELQTFADDKNNNIFQINVNEFLNSQII